MSVASMSSAGSTNDKPPTHMLSKVAKDDVDDEDGDDLDDSSHNIMHGIFGVIYTVSRERKVSWGFVIFKLFFDLWQLLTLTINPLYGWKIDATRTWWKVISVVQLNGFMMARGVTFFLILFYIFVVLLMITVAVCIWVIYSFSRKRFDHVWPITFLRWFGVIFFQVLDITSMAFFMMVLDCQYWSVPPEVQGYNAEFPEQYCWTMPWLIHAGVATISLVCFVILSASFQMGEMELNLITKNPLGMAHSKCEVLCFLLKFVMTAASVFLNSLEWLSGVYTLAALLLVYLTVTYIPFYLSWVNYVRSGIYAAVLYSAALMMIMVFHPGVDGTDPVAMYSWHNACSLALIIGIWPAAGLGALFVWLRYVYIQKAIRDKFSAAGEDVKFDEIFEFTDPLTVEIAVRCCRTWVDKHTLDEYAVRLAERMLKAGVEQLPKSPYMFILYSSFLIDVHGSLQTGLVELKAAKKLNPSLLESFAIFSREQQNMQNSSARKKGGQDLVAYVEQLRDIRLARKVHQESLETIGKFWKCLVHHEIKMEKLARAIDAMDKAVCQADSVYKMLLTRNTDNWRMLRMYAKFLEFIKNDPWSAAKFYEEADRLFQEEDEEKYNTAIEDNGNGSIDQAAHALREAMESSSIGAIVMNAQCIITMVNKPACDMLGYKVKKQMLGKNIKMIIPAPYSSSHDSFVANHLKTGHSSVLNMQSKLVCMNADGDLVPVTMKITKISGIGQDSIFMGLFEVITPPEDTASLWLTSSGLVIGTDPVYADWFGWKREDMPLGTQLDKLFCDSKAMDLILKNLREGAGKDCLCLPVDKMELRHKFGGPVPCSLDIYRIGGEGRRMIYYINVKRLDDAASMLVTDPRGKILHVSQDLARDLGFTVPALLNHTTSAWDLMIPEPFNHMHALYTTRTEQMPRTKATSCRNGLSVTLASVVDGLQIEQPYTLMVDTRKVDPSMMEKCHVMHLKKLQLAEAMSERRLSFVINSHGTIIQVPDHSHELFGFDASLLMGRPISDILDIFQPSDEEILGDETSISKHVHELLVEMALRDLQGHKFAYRVGVFAPQAPLSHIPSEPDDVMGDIISRMLQPSVPGVMQIKVMQATSANSASRFKLERSLLSGRESGRISMAGKELVRISMSGKHPGEDRVSPFKGAAHAVANASGIQLEVSLYKSDLLTGVLHLDNNGTIMEEPGKLQLYQPGLLLGVDLNALAGHHVSKIVPQMKGRPLSDIFLLNTGGIEQKKGGLKGFRGTMAEKSATSIITTSHLVDGEGLQLELQPVRAANPKNGVYIVMHLFKPNCGPDRFNEWLQVNPEAGILAPPDAGPEQVLGSRARRTSITVLEGIGSKRFVSGDSFTQPFAKRSSEGFEQPKPVQQWQTIAMDTPPVVNKRQGSLVAFNLPSSAAAEPALPAMGDLQPKRSPAELETGGNSAAQVNTALDDLYASLADDAPAPSSESFAIKAKKEAVRVHPPKAAPSNRISEWVLTGSIDFDSKAAQEEMWAPPPGSDDGLPDYPEPDKNRIKEALGVYDRKSEDGTEDENVVVQNEFLQTGANVRIGQRYKQVSRLLLGEMVQHEMKRFKLMSWSAIFVALLVTVIGFITMYILLTEVQSGVNVLNTVGKTGIATGEIYLTLVNCDMLVMNQFVEGLTGLESVDDVDNGCLQKMDAIVPKFEKLLTEAYYDVMAMAKPGSLLTEIWNTPYINVSVFDDEGIELVAVTHKMMSLLDLGNMLASSAIVMSHNLIAHNTTPGVSYWRAWSYPQFIEKNSKLVFDEIYNSLDELLTIVVDNADSVNSIQYILMAVDAGVAAILVVFVLLITAKMNKRRWKLYNVFMLIPIGMLKALATKTSDLDERPPNENGNEEEAKNNAQGGVASSFKLDIAKKQERTVSPSFWASMAETVRGILGLPTNKVSPKSTKKKRVLTMAHWSEIRMCSLFAVWGIVMVCINVLGHQKLAGVSGPIAIFNLVNFVTIQYYRSMSLLEDAIQLGVLPDVDIDKEILIAGYSLPEQYAAMVHGGSAVHGPEAASPHFALATGGVAFTGADGANILYLTTDCLRLTEACLPIDHPLREYTVRGLDTLMQLYMKTVNDVLYNVPTDDLMTYLQTLPQFSTLWNTYADITGGLTKLNTAYYNHVLGVYASTLTIHIIGLVVSCLLMAAYFFFVLRPYMRQLKDERTRIAELLSQLPQELNIEKLVNASLNDGQQQPELPTSQSGKGFQSFTSSASFTAPRA